MNKKMEQVSVRATDDEIWIEQGTNEDDSMGIVVSPDQVPILIKWLQEAVTEIEDKPQQGNLK